jgi:TRAP-type C4-dicarboxylate transport system substrate-binding protein
MRFSRPAILGLLLLAAVQAQARTVRIKLATLAPKNSAYHKALLSMANQWKSAPGGGANVVIYPDGVQGGESAVVQKLRAGQLQAAMLTSTGLGEIDGSITALQNIPLLFRSLEELDYLREKLRARMEQSIAARGFAVLFWADAGWIRFFSTEPVLRPGDLRKLKVWVWQGNNDFVDMLKGAGYHPVPLETADIYPSLQSGMIQAVPSPAIFAHTTQLYTKANHMLNLDWSPLVGATVVVKKVWDQLSPEARKTMYAAAQQTGVLMKSAARTEEEQAVEKMKAAGLTVHTPTPKDIAEWRLAVGMAYPMVRGNLVPADLFDEVRALLAERRGEKPPPKPAATKK